MKTTHDNSDFLSYSSRLRDFILKTGLPFQKAPEVLGMTGPQFMRWWNSFDSDQITFAHVRKMAQYFNLSENQILFGTYDIDSTRKQFFQEDTIWNQKYVLNQYSNTRSSAHILKYLTLTRGRHFADRVLSDLSVSPLIYQNLDNKISLSYFVDLLECLEQNGVAQKEIDTLASVLFLSLENTKLGFEFEKSQNYYDCYQTLSQNLSLFDQNFEYSSDIDSTQYQMKAFLSYDKHPELQLTPVRLAKLHRYRQILLGWFPYLSNLPPILPKVTYDYSLNGVLAIYRVYFYGTNSRPLFLCSEPKNH